MEILTSLSAAHSQVFNIGEGYDDVIKQSLGLADQNFLAEPVNFADRDPLGEKFVSLPHKDCISQLGRCPTAVASQSYLTPHSLMLLVESGLSDGTSDRTSPSHHKTLGEQAMMMTESADREMALRRAVVSSEVSLARNTVVKVMSHLCIRSAYPLLTSTSLRSPCQFATSLFITAVTRPH